MYELKQALAERLQLEGKDAVVNPVTGHIVLKVRQHVCERTPTPRFPLEKYSITDNIVGMVEAAGTAIPSREELLKFQWLSIHVGDNTI